MKLEKILAFFTVAALTAVSFLTPLTVCAASENAASTEFSAESDTYQDVYSYAYKEFSSLDEFMSGVTAQRITKITFKSPGNDEFTIDFIDLADDNSQLQVIDSNGKDIVLEGDNLSTFLGLFSSGVGISFKYEGISSDFTWTVTETQDFSYSGSYITAGSYITGTSDPEAVLFGNISRSNANEIIFYYSDNCTSDLRLQMTYNIFVGFDVKQEKQLSYDPTATNYEYISKDNGYAALFNENYTITYLHIECDGASQLKWSVSYNVTPNGFQGSSIYGYSEKELNITDLIGNINSNSVEEVTFNSPGNADFVVSGGSFEKSTSDGSAVVMTGDELRNIISDVSNVTLRFYQQKSDNTTVSFKWNVATFPVDSIAIASNDSLELTAGDTYQLTAEVSPENATNKNVSWSSDNEEVATVDNTGKITAVSAGEANITVTSEDNAAVTDTVTVKVTFPVDSIAIAPHDNLELTAGDTYQLTAEVSPENATNKNISWSSDNEEVATVDNTGKITAVSAGKANITVTSEDNAAVTDTVAVTVTTPESSDTEPIVTEPIVTEPIVTEPIVTEPVVDEPVTAAPASTWYPYTTYNSDWEVAFWGHVGLAGNQGTSVENVESGAGVSDNLSEAQRTVGAVVISIAGISAAAAFAAIRKRKSLEK